ncbi:MAG: glucosidase, partial [Leeuwenhoekiella sp.]
DELVDINGKRNREELEYELLDTEILKDNAYFDVVTEYAKANNDDILVKITIHNRNTEAAEIHLLPTLWIRNFWSFKENEVKPNIKKQTQNEKPFVFISHPYLDDYNLYFEDADKLLFTENETNDEKVFDRPNDHPYKKDLFHDTVINNDFEETDKKEEGTKFAPLYVRTIEGGQFVSIKLRLSKDTLENPFSEDFDGIFNRRQEESQDYYNGIINTENNDSAAIQKQALSGLLWTKQYYNYEVERWLTGDPESTPPPERLSGRNSTWKTLRNHDILSMPDKWEYPWYAAWDSAFHCVSLAMVDLEFAKEQLILFTREWYMAPNGQIPAYEWSFSDVNPPVQAWAAMKVYKMGKKQTGKGDVAFLKRMFNKLALNFTWWVNQEDRTQNNVFEGGFLGLDNIGVFDRSNGIPGDAHLEQVDGTSWMALYCLNLLEMSLEIALEDNTYEDMATKYFGHFIYIAEALNKRSKDNIGTWDEEEGFFYDKLVFPDSSFIPIKIRSIVGLLSITAVLAIDKETLKKLPAFAESVIWFKKYRIENLKYEVIQDYEPGNDLLLTLVPRERMQILMKSILDENEFLSPFGIRSLSKIHTKPYSIKIDGVYYTINYEPNESSTALFGGNSNWRGPIWMPINYIFIQSLREYFSHYGDSIKFNYPSSSDSQMNLKDISDELSKRLIALFTPNENGERPVNKLHAEKYKDEHFKDLILFYEYFGGDNGRGVGASHQTGWTALVANLIDEIK